MTIRVMTQTSLPFFFAGAVDAGSSSLVFDFSAISYSPRAICETRAAPYTPARHGEVRKIKRQLMREATNRLRGGEQSVGDSTQDYRNSDTPGGCAARQKAKVRSR